MKRGPFAADSIKVISIDVMPDGSGAPAVVQVGPYRFAVDILGTVRVNAIGAVRGGYVERNHAIRIATDTYQRALDIKVTADWRAANAAMYADVNGGR